MVVSLHENLLDFFHQFIHETIMISNMNQNDSVRDWQLRISSLHFFETEQMAGCEIRDTVFLEHQDVVFGNH